MRGSLPPATSVVGGINGLSRAASARLAAEIAAAAAREQQARFTVPPHFQGKTITHVDLAGDRKVIALTFDDGPWPESTNAILYILRKHDVRATFFLLGRNIRNFPERARQVAEHGHAIANHSWSHPYHQQTPASAAGQIDNTDIWIEQATGVRSQLFRPPGGYLHNGMAAYAAGKGQVVVMWSGDSKDYYASSAKIASNVINTARPGGIVLLHDGGGDRDRTINALPQIITTLRQQGYEFVTVPELLELHHQQMQATKG
ncbi:MAG: polysaccharide deacetylase family protein [Spirulinaceae cyanobacterium SM2_1_0]|nr:polysaccharide deacetylase family protein [Spirulinaceae cyanobacterium SM2_1_0]